MAYWLMKSEPDAYSIDNLKADRRTCWDGVRNYQARNMMRDDMRKGDLIFFYHSNCEVPGIVGIMKVHREGYPDPSAFDPDDKHYDPKSDPQNPRWYAVDILYRKHLKPALALEDLRGAPARGRAAWSRRRAQPVMGGR